MLSIYIITAIIGAGLIVVSLFHHGDSDSIDHGDADADASVDHGEADHSAGHMWLPFFSLRFWTYFFGGFGILGLLLRNFTSLTEPTIAYVAAGGGFVAGTLVALLMRWITGYDSNSSMKEEDLLGREAKVVVAIRSHSMGKVRANVRGETVELFALPQVADSALEAGSDVIIVAIENEKALVVPREVLFE